jgi:hypothetical protein
MASSKYATAWEKVRKRPSGDIFAQWRPYLHELEGIPADSPAEKGRFYWNNGMFSLLDAAAYYGAIRHLRPRRIIEIGSGYSTAIALMAADRSPALVEISCVEPYPSSFLRRQRKKLHALIERRIQDVDPQLFETLDAGDMLFIDSSHCSRLGSDLNILMFEIVPRLKPGVIVHFHDIFLPSEYPRSWLEDVGIMWNEQYLLLAFLMFNDTFELFWSSSMAATEIRDDLAASLRPLLPQGGFVDALNSYSGGSVWLRKLR